MVTTKVAQQPVLVTTFDEAIEHDFVELTVDQLALIGGGEAIVLTN